VQLVLRVRLEPKVLKVLKVSKESRELRASKVQPALRALVIS